MTELLRSTPARQGRARIKLRRVLAAPLARNPYVRLRHGRPRRLPVRRQDAADEEPLARCGERRGRLRGREALAAALLDSIRFYPVSEVELARIRREFPRGRYPLRIEAGSFGTLEYRQFLDANAHDIDAFRQRQWAAFAAERGRWRAFGQAEYVDDSDAPATTTTTDGDATADDPHRAWIHRVEADALRARARALEQSGAHDLPLFGIPFAIKDNIDLAGVPTTAGCTDYAYVPENSDFVVQRLLDAGAIVIGKTNLDQFATSLKGTRSPYGACRDAFDPEHFSGGSSSGSAVVLARGQVSFSLGTDTTGSGRVPAAFNHLVGLKPTCGLVSATGTVPACRSLGTVSIFALTAADAHRVFAVAQVFDEVDTYARPSRAHGFDFGSAARFRLGVPAPGQIEFSELGYADAYARACEHARGLGAELVEIDFAPFMAAARLLYEGPWVAERYQAIRAFIDSHPDSVLPVPPCSRPAPMLRDGVEYADLGPDYFDRHHVEKTIRRLLKRLADPGCNVDSIAHAV